MPDGAKFCQQCGAVVDAPPMGKCPACGADNPSAARFCAVCGAAISAAQTNVPMPTETQTIGDAPTVSTQPQDPLIPSKATEPVSPSVYGDATADARNAASIAASMGGLVTPANQSERTPATGSLPDIQNSSGDTAVVKPAKKKKTVRWIVLSVVLVIAVAALVIGLFFRGWFLNLILGDGRYAAQLEAKSILGAVDLMTPEGSELSSDDLSRAASDAIGNAAKMYRTVDAAGGEDGGIFDIRGLIELYEQTLQEAYGTNGAQLKCNLEAELSDAAKSALHLDEYADDIDEVLAAISNMSVAVEVAAEGDAMQAQFAITEGSDTSFDARLIALADGTIALSFPFASQKSIAIKLDTGEALDELDVKLDVDKTKELVMELAKIYLACYSEAEVEIEKGELEIGGVTVKGRLVLVDMTDEKVGDMVTDMIDCIADNEYISSMVMEITEYCGADYTEEDLRSDLSEVAEKVKSSTEVSAQVRTIVDYNNNILGKSYSVTVGEETYGVGYANGEDEIGASVFNDKRELLTALVIKETETSGKIHFELNSGIGAKVGFNLDYTDAAIVEFGTGKVVVGDFHVYLAGTKDSKEKGSAFRAGVKYTVDGDTYTGSMYLEAAEYGKLAFNTSVTPKDVKIGDVPADALDITEIETWTFENKESLVYLKELLTDITDACGVDGGAIDELLAPLAEMAGQAIDEKLVEPVSQEEIDALADKLIDAMEQIDTTYYSAQEHLTDDIADEAVELYNSISECYSELINSPEITKEDLDSYSQKADSYIVSATEVCGQMNEIAENAAASSVTATKQEIAKAKSDGLIGVWRFASSVMYGYEFTSEELGMADYSFEVCDDGTGYFSYLGMTAPAVWTYDGTELVMIEKTSSGDVPTVLTLENGKLVAREEGIEDIVMIFEK